MVGKISVIITWLVLIIILNTYLVGTAQNETNDQLSSVGDPHVKTIIVCEDK